MSDNTPCILLIDNGSHRAEATLSLREIAGSLSEEVGLQVNPVSLLHSTKVAAEELGGEPAQIFEPFIKMQRKKYGTHSFLVLPLFFGHSAAIYEYLPQRVMELRENNWDDLEVRIAPCLVDLGNKEDTDVATILANLVRQKITEKSLAKPAVTLVDHGTPRIAVNKVRNFLAAQLKSVLGSEVSAVEASSMERREDKEYDFNEPLLENLLGSPGLENDVVLSMLFISPGRHAGPGGDIAEICVRCEKENAELKTHMSDLFSTHPGLIELLAKRLRTGLASAPIQGEISPPN